MKKFVFFYLMKNASGKIKESAGLHSDYWNSQNLIEYLGGPFSDRAGGMIMFNLDSIDKANELVNNDPFIKFDLIDKYWIKIWEPK